MKKRMLVGAVSLAVLAGVVLSTEDKYTAKVPGGLSLSEFKGYEAWQTISVSQHGKVLAVILGNPVIINA